VKQDGLYAAVSQQLRFEAYHVQKYRVMYNVIFSKPSMCIAKAQLQKCKVNVALL